MSTFMWQAAPAAVFAVLAAMFFSGAMLRIWREEKARAKARESVASDGSTFWGRRNAEATAGKVVTKESGGSREQAKETLAQAEAEADGDWCEWARARIKDLTGERDYARLDVEDLRRAADRAYAERDEARAEWLKYRNRAESAEVRLANERLEADATVRRERYVERIAYMERENLDAEATVKRMTQRLAERNDEVSQLRGALTECRRELAEARAAQAVPVPAYPYLKPGTGLTDWSGYKLGDVYCGTTIGTTTLTATSECNPINAGWLLAVGADGIATWTPPPAPPTTDGTAQ